MMGKRSATEAHRLYRSNTCVYTLKGHENNWTASVYQAQTIVVNN